MAEIKLTSQNFDAEVLQSDQPVLVDFWATWCGPCGMLAPVIEEIAREYDGRLKVGKVDVDENRDLALQYHVLSIPTVKLFKDGKVVKETVGYQPKEEIEKLFEGEL